MKVKNPVRALGLKRSSFGQSELDNAVSTYTTIPELGVFYIYVKVPRPSPPITMLIMQGMGVFRSNIVSGVGEGGKAISRLKIYQIFFNF